MTRWYWVGSLYVHCVFNACFAVPIRYILIEDQFSCMHQYWTNVQYQISMLSHASLEVTISQYQHTQGKMTWNKGKASSNAWIPSCVRLVYCEHLQVSSLNFWIFGFMVSFRWLFQPQWAWRVMSWLSQTTCLCITTPNMGVELEDWTRRKERHHTWSTVGKARTKSKFFHQSFFVSSDFLSICSNPPSLTPLPHSLVLHSTPPLSPSQTCSLACFFLSISCFLPESHFPLLYGVWVKVKRRKC